jgi:hypothetical protein
MMMSALGALCACSSAPPVQRAPVPAPSPPPVAVVPAPVPPAKPSASTFPVAPGAAIVQTPLVPSTTAVTTEPPVIAARFPDPAVSYRTPAFEPGHPGFTSNAELRSLMHSLVRDGADAPNATSVRVIEVGSSQAGVPIEALMFSREPVPLASTGATARPTRPTVMLVGQQHGDEPAGSEALMIIARDLSRGSGAGDAGAVLPSLAPLLDRINVVILPRANPDGASGEKRLTASGIDANRDHLLLRTPEAQAQAQLARELNPMVVVDLHEYPVVGRFVEKFGVYQRADALVQYAMVANLPEFVTKASEEWFRQPILQSLKAQGLTTEWLYTTSADVADKKLSMGGVEPDIGRNVNGLRNSISLIIETRGIGLGHAHLQRRVHAHVTAVTAVLKSTAAHADDLQKLRHYVEAEVASNACKGETIVQAAATSSEYNLLALDPLTGADRAVNVTWDSALELTPLKKRPRPCGYWIGADQSEAALRLRNLGVRVQRLDEAGALRGEAYSESSRELAVRNDVRASVADAGGILDMKVSLVPALIDVPAGSYYVGLDQPLANLVIAAMEPDSPSSYVANRLVTSVSAQARVLVRPELKMTALQ